MRRDQFAVCAVDHVHEPVLVGTQQRLADLTIDMQIGKHRVGRAVEVEAFIWNVLIVPNQLAGLRPDRDHARCIQTVGAAAIGGVVRLRIARAPIDASSGSYEPFCQVAPPPYFHASGISLGQVSEPGSPGAGMVYRRHSFLPVSGSQPSRKPRVVRSPPATPVITTPFATSGAIMPV